MWGVATSSHQIEGQNDKNDWWAWEQSGNIRGGATSGKATDHLTRYAEDIELAAKLEVNSYRFSIEWSRLEPEEGQWNQKAFEWYDNLISECEKHNIVPMMTIHHFTSPTWFTDKGGFCNPDSPQIFERFVAKVVEHFGPRIPLWITLNEPNVFIIGGYIAQYMPPAVFSPQKASLASYHLLKCHVRAYEQIHSIKNRKGPFTHIPIQVGLANNMCDFVADRPWHPIERVIAKLVRHYFNTAWLDAVTGKRQHFGLPMQIPKANIVEEAKDRVTVDFIGVNYYTKAYVKWYPKDQNSETIKQVPLGLSFARKSEESSDMDWAIHPKGFKKIINKAASYNLPIYITENGIADKKDTQRPDFIYSHITEMAKAIYRGVNIKGYYHWSLLDNFEWVLGFGPRFGLYHVDYQTYERTATKSAGYYRTIIQGFRRGIPNDKKKIIKPDLEP